MGYSNVTEYQVRNLYEKEGYYLYEKEYKPKSDHNNRFEAPFANQLWHTDLHYFKENDSDEKWKYLIAFIDDRTRKILYFELLDDKSATSVSAALQKALSAVIEETNQAPHTIVTDNGKEFVNEEFNNILNCFGVRHHRTHPYTPEENVKIERFWRTFDQANTENSTIGDVIHQYNNFWSHRSLIINGKHVTPQEAWESIPKYANQSEDELKLIYQ